MPNSAARARPPAPRARDCAGRQTRGRVARRLRGLALRGLAQPAAGLARAPWQVGAFESPAPPPRAGQLDDTGSQCLALETLSETLADEPNAGAARGQALRHGAGAVLWQRALEGVAPASAAAGGAGARDRLTHALATALGDLFANRGDSHLFAATLRVGLHGRFAAWLGAVVHADRPLRVAAAGCYMWIRLAFAVGSAFGVGVTPPPPPAPPAAAP